MNYVPLLWKTIFLYNLVYLVVFRFHVNLPQCLLSLFCSHAELNQSQLVPTTGGGLGGRTFWFLELVQGEG